MINFFKRLFLYDDLTEYTCYTFTEHPKCQHKNGWYDKVTFWIFTKRVFVCTDCLTIIKPGEDE